MTTAPAPTSRPPNRAGRNLPLAIGVGLGLGGLCLAALLVVHWGWVVLATIACLIGTWELRDALAAGKIHVALVPALAGASVMPVAAYLGGPAALIVAFGVTVLCIVSWRVSEGVDGAMRDVGGGVFVTTYAPFLASFSALMLAPGDGPRRVICFILVTIASDIGGYAAGVLTGRHPMAPSVSPKKSWEGFAGSAAACIVVGALAVPLLLAGSWWAGALIGACVVLVATLGDLTESMVKRDLGIKDMGHLLPGHGGLLDRLDSLLLVAPVVWVLLLVLVPVAR